VVNSHGEQVAANGLGNGPDVQGRVRAKSRGSFLSGVAIRVTRDRAGLLETAPHRGVDRIALSKVLSGLAPASIA